MDNFLTKPVQRTPQRDEDPPPPLTRTADQVSKTALTAGLTNTRGPVQLLQFSSSLNSDEIKLLETPSDVLASLSKGETVVIRGEPNEDAVMCTKEKTYELRSADTSNALLITSSLLLPQDPEFSDLEVGSVITKEVTACLSSYLELRPCRPKIQKLKDLLSEMPYRGQEYEMEVGVVNDGEEQRKGKRKRGPTKYTFDDLLNSVQASERELIEALEKIEACPVEGYWRVFDPDYRDKVFQYILTLLEEEDWSYKCVPLENACDKLVQLEPRFAIEHCLNCYGHKLESANEIDECYELSEVKVCQFYAELLLRPAGKFNYGEFVESWQQSVPDGMTTNLDQLEGLALADMKTAPPVIWHFPVSDLPQDPTARFNRIFEVRERWTHSQIEPYICDLQTPTQSLNALLLKHARVSKNAKGEKVYNSKRMPATK